MTVRIMIRMRVFSATSTPFTVARLNNVMESELEVVIDLSSNRFSSRNKLKSCNVDNPPPNSGCEMD